MAYTSIPGLFDLGHSTNASLEHGDIYNISQTVLSQTNVTNGGLYTNDNTTDASNGGIYANNSNHSNIGAPDCTFEHPHYQLVLNINLYAMPVIVTLGTVGNILVFCIFALSHLRKLSCCMYLSARAVSDTGFLITLIMMWLERIDVRITHTHGICQLTVFLSYICAFLSVWFVVLVTIENYIRICRPFHVNLYCTVDKARKVIIGLVVFSIVFYNFSLWTTHVMEYKGIYYCAPIRRFQTVLSVFTYADTTITFVIPTVIIIVCMFAIIYKFVFNRMSSNAKGNTGECLQSLRRPMSSKGQRPLGRQVTILLFSVSTIFFLLSLPSHTMRLYMVAVYHNACSVGRIMHTIFMLLYYLNFAINFETYLACGQGFRVSCKKILCGCIKKFHKVASQTDLSMQTMEKLTSEQDNTP